MNSNKGAERTFFLCMKQTRIYLFVFHHLFREI